MTETEYEAIVATMPDGMNGFVKSWGLRQFADKVHEALIAGAAPAAVAASYIKVPEDWMEHLGFDLDAPADGVWMVIDDTGARREANLTERILWKELIAIRAAIQDATLAHKAPALEAPAAPEIAEALDRMDQLLNPANGLLTIGDTSATLCASRDDMRTIRASLAAAPQAPAAPSADYARMYQNLADAMGYDSGKDGIEWSPEEWAAHLLAAYQAAPAAPALSAAPIPVMPRAITAGLGLDDSGEEPAYCVMVAFRQEDDARYALSILSAGLGATAAPAAGNWIAAEEVDRLVRDLDVALHGEADAAPQASLCDIVGLAKAAAGKLGRPVLAAPAAPAEGEVLVEVIGLTGSGKSAICGEIEILCRALGLDVSWPDGDPEKNMTHAEWTAAIEAYKPRVRIVERNVPRQSNGGPAK